MLENKSTLDRADRKRRIKEAKFICKDYIGAKLRVKRYPGKRPTFFRQMKVNLDQYEETGIVDYDRELEKKLDLEDTLFLWEYVDDMLHVWIVEHVVSDIQNEITRGIAEDTIFKGQKCSDLESKYGLKERAIQARKRKVIEKIAAILP